MAGPIKKYMSRDLSWLKFNKRVLDQVKKEEHTLFQQLKFLTISAANLDEFLMIRLGSLYNYIDYGRKRIDNSGLDEITFRKKLLTEAKAFCQEQHEVYIKRLVPAFGTYHFKIIKAIATLNPKAKAEIEEYFKKTVFPMLTPMVFDSHHAFPMLMNKILILGVVTCNGTDQKDNKKLSFVQIPKNLPRFYEIKVGYQLHLVPIEEIIRTHIGKLFRHIEILTITLFRVTRNGDFSLEESDDIEANFLEELKKKLKKRKTGRVVRIEIEKGYDRWMIELLKNQWQVDEDNLFVVSSKSLVDLTGLSQITTHTNFKDYLPPQPATVLPMAYPQAATGNIFDILQQKDILLHHPYNSLELVIDLLEKAAEDPYVLSIKLTIYRLAKDSAITATLLKAVENGKHVAVLFELKARFDEEHNMREAQKLQKAGCFVIYGVSSVKTHSKLLLIVRKKGPQVTCYVHLASGNYNEETAKIYSDIGLLTTNKVYAHDVSEFFNVITGHSLPIMYENIITAPLNMRKQLIELIDQEANNAQQGLPCGIVIKINALGDEATIDALYTASQAGVPIQLIVRGICCLIPGKKGLSENITVRSIIGEFLEHTRLFYFHNQGNPKVYAGSADIMVRSFDRRIESLFIIKDPLLKQEAIHILDYNLRDNVNTYWMQEDGGYVKKSLGDDIPFDMHKAFFNVTIDQLRQARLFTS